MFESGSWIFLSHSSEDIAVVRKIRNEFERMGHNPLAFHLKCLSDETEEGKKELDDLIKREIQARDWFVLCNSENARNSNFVKQEVDYIKEQKKKKVFEIDITEDIDEILKNVREICMKVGVEIIFVSKDQNEVDVFKEDLRNFDYSVTALAIDDGDQYRSIAGTIDNNVRPGIYFFVISKNSIKESRLKEEMHYCTLENIPFDSVIVGTPKIPAEIQNYIDNSLETFTVKEKDEFEIVVERYDKKIERDAKRFSRYVSLYKQLENKDNKSKNN